VSPGIDTWVVIHTSGKQQDLLLECIGSPEKLSEFVTVLYAIFHTCTGNQLPVKFEMSSTFRGDLKKKNTLTWVEGGEVGKATKGKGQVTINTKKDS